MLNRDHDRRLSLASGFQAVLAADRNTILRAARLTEPILDFARSVAEGMTSRPRRFDCRFLYDAAGSALYERITRLPEYYPTRTEEAILAGSARRLRALAGPVSLLELGSGSSQKTAHLLDAWLAEDASAIYIPVDVSESALLQANRRLSGTHPRARVIGIHGTYEDALHLAEAASPVMMVFLGSTLGNFAETQSSQFLRRVAGSLAGRDFFLLGVDLVKQKSILEAAYNDDAGVTAAFTRNLFARMNRELGAALDLDAIEHVARWSAARRRIEIHARFRRSQELYIQPLDRRFAIAAGEEILVEISRKFELAELPPMLAGCGFDLVETFTDPRGWFALLLLRPLAGRSWI